MAFIECVPNVSEGRRPDVIARLVRSITTVPGVRLLDHSADPSHNRSVFTFAGAAGPVTRAVYALVDAAMGAIDLRAHRGEHPRIGAVDVIPFVPLGRSTLDDCVALARETGLELARRFDLPVFLYEAAAATPGRRNLADVRRGGFEALAARMATPEWTPDFGPATPHPTAGATAVGARKVLIAFNVNLDTDSIEVARAIARAVRERDGGLPCVKALGIRLAHRQLAQVSMNLTDYERTPISAVMAAVRREAARHGAGIRDTEIIGLVPSAALLEVAIECLRLQDFRLDRVLEQRLDLTQPAGDDTRR